MKKKLCSLLVVFMLACCFGSVSTFAFYGGGANLYGQQDLPAGRVVPIAYSFDYNSSYAGSAVQFGLIGANVGTNGLFYSSGFADIVCTPVSVIDGNGMPVPYSVLNSSMIVYLPDDYSLSITINFEMIYNGSSSVAPITAKPPDTVNFVNLGDTGAITLSEYLYWLDLDLNSLSNNVSALETYLQILRQNSNDSNANLQNIIGKLEWIVSEMEGQANASIGAMGEYTGYNYSQLFVEMINAIKNISIGDISGNITVQTDLSEVINNLVTVANAYNNINQFDYTGKMYFRPVSVVARQYVTEGTPKIVNPPIEYHTMVGLPSFTLGERPGVVYCDTFNMKMGINENTTFPLMPGRYRFRIRILAPDYYSNEGHMSQTQVYFYNTQIGWIQPEWYSTADAYNSGYITHSCEFVIDVPAGNYPGSLQLSNSAGMLVLGSKFTVEITDLDRTQTDILASTQRIEQLVARNNELLAGLTGTVENSGLSDAMQDFDGYENDAQTNFDDHMTVVDDAMSTITGVTTSDKMFSVVSFINGNFTSIWEALGRFKYLIILNLLAGLALVFVGRSGKVK